MIKRLARLLGVVLILSVALSFVLLNRESVTVRFWGDSSISAMAGVIFIAIFLLGFLISAAGAAFFGIQAFLRERKLRGQIRNFESAEDGFSRACEAISNGDSSRAERDLESIIKRFPKHISAYVELSELYASNGELSEAIKVIDRARSVVGTNSRLLFLAADLHLKAGNRTAAIDSLALILFNSPNERAARMARDVSEQLGRLGDAIEYSERLGAIVDLNGSDKKALHRIQFKMIREQYKDDLAGEKTALLAFLKRASDCDECALRLAEISKNGGDIEGAAQFYVRAAKASGDMELWRIASDLWLMIGSPERAIAAARAAVKESSSPRDQISANLQLSRVYLELGMLEEFWAPLEAILKLSREKGLSVSDEQKRLSMMLASSASVVQSDVVVARQLLNDLIDGKIYLASKGANGVGLNSTEDSPAPRLSTP